MILTQKDERFRLWAKRMVGRIGLDWPFAYCSSLFATISIDKTKQVKLFQPSASEKLRFNLTKA